METAQYQAKIDFLNSYRWRRHEARALNKRIEDLEDQLTSLRAQRITDMPRGGKAKGFDELIVQKEYVLSMYRDDLVRAEKALSMIYECIRSVDHIRDRTILSMIYVDGMSYTRVGELLNYSKKQIQRFNRHAVENMQISQSCLAMSTDVTGAV